MSILARPAGTNLPERIKRRTLSRILVDDGCWIWTGTIDKANDHGLMWNGKATVPAHRLVYEWLVAPVAPELQLDHLCRNSPCVRPDHMEPVTPKVNQNRGKAADHWRAKTHCPYGHPYDETNTRISKAGSRCCRICERKRTRAWKIRTNYKGHNHAPIDG